MVHVFDLAEYFYKYLARLGDFFMFQPFSSFLNGIDLSSNPLVPEYVRDLFDFMQDLTLGSILLGVGLITILRVKLAKFILDLIF